MVEPLVKMIQQILEVAREHFTAHFALMNRS